jgi:hypothetical protein
MRSNFLRILTVALACLGALAAGAAPLTVLVEPTAPFVVERAGPPTGPYVEAFQRLAAGHGVETTVLAMPIRRALVTAQRSPNTCILALNYAPETAEVMLFLGRVAPMYVWAYARRDAGLKASNLADLKRLVVGSIDIAEVRLLLRDAGVPYEPLPQLGRGLQMLQAKRFDVLISDVAPELEAERVGAHIEKLFTVARVERWLACNPNTEQASLMGLRQSLKDGLFADSVQDIWVRYGLEAYYDHVRKEWSAASKSWPYKRQARR